MMLRFHTSNHVFDVTKDQVFRDGEVIAEGTLQIHQLLFGIDGIIEVISHNSFCPPLYLHTDTITSILPDHEVYQGVRQPEKKTYWVELQFECERCRFNVQGVSLQIVKTWLSHHFRDKPFKLIELSPGEWYNKTKRKHIS